MKKLLSLLMSVAMIATMMTAFGLTASAAEVSEKFDYYTVDNVGTISYAQGSDTIDTDLYDIEEKTFSDPVDTRFDVYQITKPCVIYGYFMCNNKDQNATALVPNPTSLNYEIALSIGEPKNDLASGSTASVTFSPNQDWSDCSYPMLGNDQGDYEYRKIIVTDKDIIAAGGTVSVYFGARAKSFRNNNIEALKQTYTAGVRIYTLKGASAPIAITNPATTGNSTLTMSGVAIPAPTYTVTIPTSIDFGTCNKAMANDTEENKIKTIAVSGLSVTHSNLYANEKKVTVTIGSDFTMKDTDNNALSFELYDGETKLADNTVLITANPTENDTDASTEKSLTAKLDKTQIKKSGSYTGTITFTVAMLDAE